jgi:Flp pilus assembly protein TadD
MFQQSYNILVVVFSLLIISLTACATTDIKTETISQVQNIPDVVRVKYQRAVWAAKSGQHNEAIALFSMLTREYPTLARSFTNLGMLYLERGELISAEQTLLQAVKVYPYDAVAQNHLGVVLRELGKFKQAEQAYLYAIKYDSDYKDAFLNLGILYDLYLHDTTKAILFYKKAQVIGKSSDELLDKWLLDAERRVNKDLKTPIENS